MLRNKATVDSFTEFVEQVEPRLRNALIPTLGLDGAREATAEALAYGWEHWARIQGMENSAGYLYRVARTAARRTARSMVRLPPVPSEKESGPVRFDGAQKEGIDSRITRSALLPG